MRAIWMEPGKLPEVREVGDLRCEWEDALGGTADVEAIATDCGIVHLRWGRQMGLELNVRMDIAPLSFEGKAPVQQEIGFYGPVMFVGIGPDGPTDIDDDAGLLIMSGMAFGNAVKEE